MSLNYFIEDSEFINPAGRKGFGSVSSALEAAARSKFFCLSWRAKAGFVGTARAGDIAAFQPMRARHVIGTGQAFKTVVICFCGTALPFR